MPSLPSHAAAARPIRVGFTEAHGLAREYSLAPPPGVEYSFLPPAERVPRLLRSPIKGYLGSYDHPDVDLIEAVLSPIRTSRPWIFTCADFGTAAAFNLLGVPLPLPIRMVYLRHLLLADNCKRIVFRSHAGRKTIETYGKVRDPRLLDKTTVVYPAVRVVDDSLIRFNDTATSLLFSGDFFRKGGASVVDAFERLQQSHPEIRLTLCCADSDFQTPNTAMREEYLARVHRNPGIVLTGRLSRAKYVDEVLPAADVYLMPSYVESFGFAILEAMARGVPVISTNSFAIPEMIEHGANGLLVDTAPFDADNLFRGYVVNHVPPAFHRHVSDSVLELLRRLVEDAGERRRIGLAGLAVVREKFSFATRNARMRQIYDEALA